MSREGPTGDRSDTAAAGGVTDPRGAVKAAHRLAGGRRGQTGRHGRRRRGVAPQRGPQPTGTGGAEEAAGRRQRDADGRQPTAVAAVGAVAHRDARNARRQEAARRPPRSTPTRADGWFWLPQYHFLQKVKASLHMHQVYVMLAW